MPTNGGIIGPRNLPTASVASGVWTLEDAQIYKAAGIWPKQKASITFTDESRLTTSTTEYTFTTQALGTAAADRYLIIGVEQRFTSGTPTITSVTVGGVAATALFTEIDGGAATSSANMYIVAYPTGTTADIVVNHSGGCTSCGIGVWAAYGLRSATPTDSGTSNTTGAMTTDLDVLEDSVAVGFVLTSGSGAARTTTWTNLSEDFDITVAGFNVQSGASAAFATPATVTVTATPSGAVVLSLGLFASFR